MDAGSVEILSGGAATTAAAERKQIVIGVIDAANKAATRHTSNTSLMTKSTRNKSSNMLNKTMPLIQNAGQALPSSNDANAT